ncbi:MAG: glucosamine-6-phosphate deaminase [cyanobacterium endosymbiont of Rhopalodia sterrenbergii]
MKSEYKFKVDTLSVYISKTEKDLAERSAEITKKHLLKVLEEKEEARVILATGNSQLQFLDTLMATQKIDWNRITLFHLDEYLGINKKHQASFCHYLQKRVEKRVYPKQFHYIRGNTLEPVEECDRYTELLQENPIDLCCLGIGTNGHLAFNEPAVARFDDSYWVKLVRLEEETRQVQVNQGHFSHLHEVPKYAITLTIPMILLSRKIICLALGRNKAKIVETMLKKHINTHCPASILRKHSDADLFLEQNSAHLL